MPNVSRHYSQSSTRRSAIARLPERSVQPAIEATTMMLGKEMQARTPCRKSCGTPSWSAVAPGAVLPCLPSIRRPNRVPAAAARAWARHAHAAARLRSRRGVIDEYQLATQAQSGSEGPTRNDGLPCGAVQSGQVITTESFEAQEGMKHRRSPVHRVRGGCHNGLVAM
ncbi:hypothetical protein HaLaN_08742 [Haematococcus lacustris]|uniref:Uncharacterized protein n=1 Tax=Haematococcus lacustris TaxID=44745 RepID=A0A699YUN7_HAELA|nr:hypothetical protein HaLaN_08742 [Haematococcus lacustris]